MRIAIVKSLFYTNLSFKLIKFNNLITALTSTTAVNVKHDGYFNLELILTKNTYLKQ